ncbi:MAG: tail fiber domain-containing protein [Bacteroidales bacterium]|nr:tail fiber domain-containing protein [Bacteroidales bacterium]
MNWRKALILIFVIGIFSYNSNSQNIAITDDDGYSPDASAMLDVKSTTKGMLVPRVALVTTVNPIGGTKPEGLLVWNTSTSGTYDTPGFYFWNGADWEMVGSDNLFENGLTQSGNTVKLGGALTNATTITQGSYNMIYNLNGTGDFDIQDNGTSAFFVRDDGNVGIGTNSPVQKLQVNGNIKIDENVLIAGNSNHKIYNNLASYYSSSNTGAVVIETGHPMSASCMFRIKIEGYAYDNPAGPFEINIGSYKSTTSFSHAGYLTVGPDTYTVRLAENISTANMVIILGTISTNTSYLSISVTEYTQGYQNRVEAYAEGWSISRLTDLSNYDRITDIPNITEIDLSNYYTQSEVDNIVNNENHWDRTGSNTYLHNSSDNIGVGTSSPLHQLHISKNISVTNGTDGNFIDIQNTNTNYYVMSGLRFINGSSSYIKGGIFYQDRTSYGRGNILFANRSSTSGTVSADDTRMIIDYNGNVGIGVGNSYPSSRLVVEGNSSGGIDDPLFEVKNNAGQTIFAVYNEGVRIWVDDTPGKATGSKGGFAVGGLNAGKGITNEYLRITPDSIRMYIDTTQSTKGSKGGFAVGGLNAGKTNGMELLRVTDDSVRIYVKNNPSKATGSKGGFAVGGLNAGKDVPVDFLHLNPKNYFIGHETGKSITNGEYNTFFGYQSGHSTSGGTGFEGSYNIFVGYKSGYNNTSGYKNVFMGYRSGLTNTSGQKNTFIGNESGANNSTGGYNTFFGYNSGILNSGGNYNTFIGADCGFYNSSALFNTCVGSHAGENLYTGSGNTFIGAGSGHGGSTPGQFITGGHNTYIGYYSGYGNKIGSGNVCVGYQAGSNETGSDKLYIENTNATSTSALIYGDFNTNILRFNADVGIGKSPSYKLDVQDNASGYVAKFFNDGNSSNRYGIRIQAGSDDGNGYNYMIAFYDGNGSYAGALVLDANLMKLVQNSDKRLKENINNTKIDALKIIKDLRVVDYNFIEGSKITKTGYIAQEAIKVFPDLVSYNEEMDKYGISLSTLVPILNKAIQEQQKQIEILKSENKNLKTEVNKIEQLQKQINKLNELMNVKASK